MAIVIFFISMLHTIFITYFAPALKFLLRGVGTLQIPHRRLKRRRLTSLAGALSLWLMVSGLEAPSVFLSPTAATTSLPDLLRMAPEKIYAILVRGLETIGVIYEIDASQRAHVVTSAPTVNRLTRLSPLPARPKNSVLRCSSLSLIWYEGTPTPEQSLEPPPHPCSVASRVTGHRSSPTAGTTVTSSHQQLAVLLPQLLQPTHQPLTTDLNPRPHNTNRKDVDAMLLNFDTIKSLWFWYGNAKVQRLKTVKTSAMLLHLNIFSVSVKVNSTSKSELSIGSAMVAHQPKAVQAPTMSTMLFVLASNSSTVSEKKIVSTVSPSCLPIFVLSGSFEIHLVSRVNLVGFRVSLNRLMGSLAFTGFSPFFQTLQFQRRFRLFEALSSCGFKDSSEDYLRISLLLASLSLEYFYPMFYCSTVIVIYITVEHTSGCNRCTLLDFN